MSEYNDLESGILQGLKEAVAYAKGELTEEDGVTVHKVPVIPKHINVKDIRSKLGLSQNGFSQFGFSPSAIKHWEQGLRNPEPSTRAFLKVLEKYPEIVIDALSEDNNHPQA